MKAKHDADCDHDDTAAAARDAAQRVIADAERNRSVLEPTKPAPAPRKK
jgi:hypothetical protein